MTSNPHNDYLYAIALSLIPKIGPKSIKSLIKYCGSAKDAYFADKSLLAKIPNMGPQSISNLKSHRTIDKAKIIFESIEKNKIDIFFYTKNLYPSRLKAIPDAPPLLFSQGNGHFDNPRSLAIVGTRTPSNRALNLCRQIIEELSPFHPTIISGLAYGIDSCVHQMACELKLNNIAVLAHGHQFIYPKDHIKLAQKIKSNGALVSEFNFFEKIKREHFPMRNRIIAALADACLVIESPQRGGSIITAQLAFDYNREVFAIPGRPTDGKSKGCNALIKTHKASLIESAQDIIRALSWEEHYIGKAPTPPILELFDCNEELIIKCFQQKESLHIDEILMRSGLSFGILNRTLLAMELKSYIRSMPGKRFILSDHLQ